MKYYEYLEPIFGTPNKSRLVVLSEKKILELYWDYWSENMRMKGKSNLISEQNCISDYVVINWAYFIGEF
jgi:hypothetical protein